VEGSLAAAMAAETEAVEKEKEASLAVETDAVEKEVAFKIFKNFEKIDFDLIVGNNKQERFADIYRMAQMSELDREAELAKCHDAHKAHQDMQKLQEQQRQVDHMRASVAEQTKRREQESLKMSRNQVSFLV
jgi:uncharacterized protein (UPF0128 family)